MCFVLLHLLVQPYVVATGVVLSEDRPRQVQWTREVRRQYTDGMRKLRRCWQTEQIHTCREWSIQYESFHPSDPRQAAPLLVWSAGSYHHISTVAAGFLTKQLNHKHSSVERPGDWCNGISSFRAKLGPLCFCLCSDHPGAGQTWIR